MKYLPALLFAVLFSVGCMNEDMKNCPLKDNVTIYFSLKDTKTGAEIFTQKVSQTDMFVFDDTGRFIRTIRVTPADLDASNGMVVTLQKGNYKLLCWGNIERKCTLGPVTSSTLLDDAYLSFDSNDSCDPLYYSPLVPHTRTYNPTQQLVELSVPEEGKASTTMEFTHAHKQLEIYVQGFSDNGLLPVIELTGHKSGYDFYMNHLSGQDISFLQQSEMTTTPEGDMAFSPFYTSRIRKDNNTIVINIKKASDGTTAFTTTLSDVIKGFVNFDLEEEVVIPIVFKFINNSVSVTIPTWGYTPITPGV